MEALGAEIEWNGDTQEITAKKGDKEIVLAIGNDTAYVNGKAEKLVAVPEITDGAAMVPIRFIAEQMGMKVNWDGQTKLITVTGK